MTAHQEKEVPIPQNVRIEKVEPEKQEVVPEKQEVNEAVPVMPPKMDRN